MTIIYQLLTSLMQNVFYLKIRSLTLLWLHQNKNPLFSGIFKISISAKLSSLIFFSEIHMQIKKKIQIQFKCQCEYVHKHACIILMLLSLLNYFLVLIKSQQAKISPNNTKSFKKMQKPKPTELKGLLYIIYLRTVNISTKLIVLCNTSIT